MILDDLFPNRSLTDIVGYPGVTAKGIAIDGLVPILTRNGLRAQFRSSLTIDALRTATSKGNPAIVAIRTPGGGHAVIVDGITTRLGKEVVAIRDPRGIQYFQTLDEFKKVFLRQGIVTGS
ncbi:MAG: hypothetical protein KatS3mg105_4691 [Gemmatales bacterium]|nr:MAG: hypothetical protein KatS3mg105_4691 [Gemmatales bacterium]